MYSDSDLDSAVAAGALTPASAAALRAYVSRARQSPMVDEEQFRLITGFNDIFVSIAGILFLTGCAWAGGSVTPWLGAALVAVSSWGMAEYFTAKRRMALPSIIFLLAFVGGVFAAFGTFLVPVLLAYAFVAYTVPARKLHVGASLDFEQLALVETLAIGSHAVFRAAPKPGETVLVIGAGPIGLSVIEFAKLSGARTVVMDMTYKPLATPFLTAARERGLPTGSAGNFEGVPSAGVMPAGKPSARYWPRGSRCTRSLRPTMNWSAS